MELPSFMSGCVLEAVAGVEAEVGWLMCATAVEVGVGELVV